MTDHDDLARQLIIRWRDDPGSTYRTWFLWKERIKNSRSIRRGLARVAAGLDDAGTVAGAFEVKHTTSIHSGIVRLLDLALGTTVAQGLFLVAPDGREGEVAAQHRRLAFSRVADLGIRYLPYGELERNREAISRFGSGMRGLQAILRTLGGLAARNCRLAARMPHRSHQALWRPDAASFTASRMLDSSVKLSFLL